MADDDHDDLVDAQTLFAARTTAKRKHTNTVKRARTLIVNAASRVELEAFMPTLTNALNELVDIHERYVAAAELDAEEQEAAETYLQGIQQLHNTCVEAINRVRQVRVGRQGWNVSNSGLVPNRTNPRDEQPESLSNIISPHDSASAIQKPGLLDHNGHLSVPNEELEPTDQLKAAIKRKLDLEFLLVQKKILQERDVKDLATKNEREQEDLMMRIRRESQLLAGLEACRAVAFEDYHFTSSPLQTYQNNLPGALVPTNPSTSNIIHQAPVTPRHHNSSYREPRLVVAKFDGDPRRWPKYAAGIKATLADTDFAESVKLLSLQETLLESIQRRMAHIFTGGYSFESAWAQLQSKYGDPALIIQAHNQYLLQLLPFKNGDFDSLFHMATAVHDAVSSVGPEHIDMFTYSTVVGSLHVKLPINLQTDWGRYAYELRRVPSLKDFDSWIDAIVGAEELRGAKLSSTGNSNAAKPPASGTTNRNNRNQNQPGSSNYNNRNPTVLAQSLLEVAVFPECPACKESPGHRLEMWNVFKRMIVNARAALCASNNHCFKCLIRGHYTRKCRRQNTGCKECGGPHHSLLHGADRQFPEASTNKGNNHPVLLVKSMDSGVRPVLLAIVQLFVKTFDSVRTTYAVLDPGSEATLVTRSLANSLNLKGPPLLVRFGSFWDSLLVESNVVTTI